MHMAKEKEIMVIDDSRDRTYFTIVPNYILNHSSATDQALYMQMKRLAGEEGVCYASRAYLMKQLNIGKSALANSFKYLIEHGWISVVEGKKAGKTGQLAVYKINDIWKLNSETYEQRGSRTASLEVKEGLEQLRKKELSITRSNTKSTTKELVILPEPENLVGKDIRKLFDHYMELHKEYISDNKPIVLWPQATNLAKPLMKELGLKRMTELLDAYFEDDKNNLYKQNMWSITCFLSSKVINILHQKV